MYEGILVRSLLVPLLGTASSMVDSSIKQFNHLSISNNSRLIRLTSLSCWMCQMFTNRKETLGTAKEKNTMMKFSQLFCTCNFVGQENSFLFSWKRPSSFTFFPFSLSFHHPQRSSDETTRVFYSFLIDEGQLDVSFAEVFCYYRAMKSIMRKQRSSLSGALLPTCPLPPSVTSQHDCDAMRCGV